MFNRSQIFATAWKLFRKGVSTFSETLRMAWDNAKTAATAKAEAGISEEVHTWSGWRDLGYEVVHDSKALYKATLADPTTKKGTRVTAYFGASQVQPISA